MYLLSSLITRIVLKESLMKGIQEKNFFSAPYVDCSFSTVFLVFIKTNKGFEEIISFVTFRGLLFR